jgi:hypothetical protein
VTGSQGGAVAYARFHRFEMDDPVSLDDRHDRVTALDYLIRALGAELVVGFCARTASVKPGDAC